MGIHQSVFNEGEKGAVRFILQKSETLSKECLEIWLLFFPLCLWQAGCAVLPNINALLLQLLVLKGVRSTRGLGAAPQIWTRPPGPWQVLSWRRMTWTSSLPPLRRSCLPSPPLCRVPGNQSSLLKPSESHPKLLLVQKIQTELVSLLLAG